MLHSMQDVLLKYTLVSDFHILALFLQKACTLNGASAIANHRRQPSQALGTIENSPCDRKR
jgi:hypothetical protein